MANSDHSPALVDAGKELLEIKVPPSSIPLDGVVSSDITIDSSRSLWFRLYVPVIPTNAPALPVIVYYHGGGFLHFSPDIKPCDDLCRKLARELPAVVVSVNYRLAPQHRCPAQYEDGFDALKFLDSVKSKEIVGFPANADVEKCFLAGDSAGGNLAHHVAVKAAHHEFQAVRVCGLILLQPFFGAEERSESELRLRHDPLIPLEQTDFMWSQFLPVGSNRDHPAANVFGSNSEDLSRLNFPSTLVAVGGSDPLHDWDVKYYEWLLKSGREAKIVEYPNMPHGFYGLSTLPQTSMLVSEIKGFVHTILAK